MNTLLQNIVKKQAKSYIDCQNFMDMNKLNALIEAFILPEILYFHLVWMFPTNAFLMLSLKYWQGHSGRLGLVHTLPYHQTVYMPPLNNPLSFK